MIEREFLYLIRDILHTPHFRGTKHYRHHVRGSVFDHSLRVAYLCYRHAKRHPSRYNVAELVRGALLHDYYLYDWHDRKKGTRLHLFTHPRAALRHAKCDYPDLTPAQRDAILRHMFPLIPVPPHTRVGWLVCYYDKIAALCDYLGKNKWKKKKVPKRYEF